MHHRVLVCGSRGWRDREAIYMKLCELDPKSWIVMEGEATGADQMAHDIAQELGLTVEGYPPDPSRPSPQRYHERNDLMLERADRVIAFWDGRSRGTASVIHKARLRCLEVEVVQ